jgi:DDE superfamily endonuclease
VSHRWQFFNADKGVLRGHIDVYVRAMMDLSAIKIAWKDWGGRQYIILVDGVHFRISEPRTDPSASWMSYKFQLAGLAYEIALSLTSNDIVWINGPFQASVGNSTIFKDHGLAVMMGPNQKAVADRGYLSAGPGYDEKLAIRNKEDSTEMREFKKHARARQENVNARMKKFEILQTMFRHDHSKHEAVVHAVALCVQYDMQNGAPLMDL